MATIQDELQLTSTDATQMHLPIAGMGSRSYAFLIDWHIRLILALAWLIGSAAIFGQLEGLDFWEEPLDSAGSLIFFLIILPPALVYFLYHPVLEVLLKGRTPGKRAAGIRIVTLDGQTPDTAALLIRNIFRLLDSLPVFYVVGIICVLLSSRQVRVGDIAAGTLLAHDKKLKGDAFERFATPANVTVDLATMELAQDLLSRWKSLAPEKRSEIAAKLIAGQGQTISTGLSKRDLDREMHERLTRLANVKRA